jgi:hypothetical protein
MLLKSITKGNGPCNCFRQTSTTQINLYGKEQAWEKVTVRTLQERKKKNVKITCVTAYDQWSAKICDNANIDVLLIGMEYSKRLLMV